MTRSVSAPIVEVGILEEFHKFELKCISMISTSVWDSESGNISI